ncbi:MAG: Uma2 family endonuclease [Hormoscilla sp. GM102CHS1]|nr:Uma2 family endonuclease [Hormoscilla sp. GM102CHS1]
MVTSTIVSKESEVITLDDYMRNPPDKESEVITLDDYMRNPPDMEWVDGQLLEKKGMTLKHGQIQLRLGSYWKIYKESNEQGGEVYTDAPCRTIGRGRKPDVAYLTPNMLAQFGNEAVLPQSFPLIAEIISPTDRGEEFIGKSQEYLQSGCQEVWLVFPESRWIIVTTTDSRQLFVFGEVASTQKVLLGFNVAVDELSA